jgi:hypothetical protein
MIGFPSLDRGLSKGLFRTERASTATWRWSGAPLSEQAHAEPTSVGKSVQSPKSRPCLLHRSVVLRFVRFGRSSRHTDDIAAPRSVCLLERSAGERLSSIVSRKPRSVREVAESSQRETTQRETTQRETTRFRPDCPCSSSKLQMYWTTAPYREGYGIFACNGTLPNHESPRRGETVVGGKIIRAVARICAGFEQPLYFGNLRC